MSIFKDFSAGPFFRFVVELSTWVWLFLIGLWYIAIIDMLMVALLNYPGDKRPEGEGVIGLAVPGKVRVLVEVITAIFGLLAAVLALGIYGGFLQLFLTMAYMRYDTSRLSWLWGWQTYPPEYVTNMHNLRGKKSN